MSILSIRRRVLGSKKANVENEVINMSKQVFLDQLRKSIASINDYEFINDTIAYYEDYIESEIRKGSTEQEVLSNLGEPRLIAKSILATHDFDSEGTESTQHSETNSGEKVFNRKGKKYRIPIWLYKILIIICAVAVIGLAFVLISWLAPVIVIAALAYFLYKFIKNSFS